MNNRNETNIIDNNILNDYIDCDFSQLSKIEYDAICKECSHYKNTRAASIEVLKIIQKRRGWVSDDEVVLVAQILRISVSDVESVATFYNQIFRQPVGKHIIRYCDSIVCYIMGCKELQTTLENMLNVKIGDTTIDKRFTLLPTCCLGMCDVAPIMMIDEDTYFHVDSCKIINLLNLYK